MAITAKMVADLRAQTGCGMMDCKKALEENDGDMDKALKLGICAGSASAFSEDLATQREVDALMASF